MSHEWPTIVIELDPLPSAEAWEYFCAIVASEPGCLGIAEAAQGAGPRREGAPENARIFFDDESAPSALDRLTEAAQIAIGAEGWKLTPEALADQDWGATWRAFFHTARVGDRVWCGPPWEADLPADAAANAILIQIDPGQAFGTGTHETTRLCMRLLESEELTGRCLADIGAGSGILCFTAVRLGASHGIGVEYDPVCEENFHLNAGLNGVAGAVTFICSPKPADGVAQAVAAGAPPPDLGVCNMLSERFLPLLAPLRSLNIPVYFSGFLVEETEKVYTALRGAGFSLGHAETLGEWGAVRAE